MSSYLSSFLGALAAQGEAATGTQEFGKDHAQAESVPWIRMRDNKQQGGRPQIVCNPSAAKEVFDSAAEVPLNIVSIFGAARQGKSFLMNLLAGRESTFKISNSKDPCTQGVDVSRRILPWMAFHRLEDPDTALAEKPSLAHASSEPLPRIAFCDCEGQGDRDVSYDANLVCPVLLASKVAIFNWKDSLQRDRLLNLLAVLQRAAYNVSTDDDEEEDDGEQGAEDEEEEGGSKRRKKGQQKLFGHLHIVFRDWTYAGDEQSVYKTLFTNERVATPDATARNELRRVLQASFESISVWLLPPPVEQTSQLSKALHARDLSMAFRQQVKKLRHAIALQLKATHHFHGRVLTGTKIANLVPTVARELNSGKTVLPKSAYQSLIEAEAAKAQLTYLTKLQQALDGVKAEAEATPMPTARLKVMLQAEAHKLQREFDRWASSVGEAAMQHEAVQAFSDHCDKALEDVLSFNRQHYLAGHLHKAGKKARDLFDESFTRAIVSRLPLAPEVVVREGQRARAAAEATVKRVVAGETEMDELLADVLEGVSGHAELQLAKVEKQNSEKLAQVQARESGVYDEAKAGFLQAFYQRLAQLNEAGPISDEAFSTAYDSSLQEATAQIDAALNDAGPVPCPAARRSELKRFLTDTAELVKAEQAALYQLRCTQSFVVATCTQLMDVVTEIDSLAGQAGADEASIKAAYKRIEAEKAQQIQEKMASLPGVPDSTAGLCIRTLDTVSQQCYSAMVGRALGSAKLAAQVDELKAQLKEQDKEQGKLQAQLKDKEKEQNKLQAQLKEVEKEQGKLQSQLKESEGKVQAAEAAKGKLKEDLLAANRQTEQTKEDLTAARREVEQAQQEAARAKAAPPSSSKKRKADDDHGADAKGEDDEEAMEVGSTGSHDDDDTAAGGSGKPTHGGRKASRTSRASTTPNGKATRNSAGGSGGKLEAAKLEERKRIEEETRRRITRGK